MLMSVRRLLEVFGRGLLYVSLGALSQFACATAEAPRGKLVAQHAGDGPQLSDSNTTRAEAEVREFLRAVTDNEINRDRAAAERLLADDFVRTGPHGEVWDRAQTLANFTTDGGSPPRTVNFEDERVRVYDDTAVVTGLGVLRGADRQGRASEVRNRCTFVLVRRDGRWQAVAVHQTRAD